MTDKCRLGYLVLPMAACQANRSYLADVSLFRYFVLTDRKRAGNNRGSAQITRVSGEVEVLFSHWLPLSKAKSYARNVMARSVRCLFKIALIGHSRNCRATDRRQRSILTSK